MKDDTVQLLVVGIIIGAFGAFILGNYIVRAAEIIANAIIIAGLVIALAIIVGLAAHAYIGSRA